MPALHYDSSAVPSVMNQLALPVPLASQPAIQLLGRKRMNRLEYLVASTAQDLLFGPSVKAFRPLVPVDDLAAKFPHKNCVVRLFQHVSLPLYQVLGPLALGDVDHESLPVGGPNRPLLHAN